MDIPPVNYSQYAKPPKRRWFVAPLIVAVAWGGMFLIGRLWDGPVSVVNNITVGGIRALISRPVEEEPLIPLRDDPDYQMPEKERNRLDILILGMRGKDDPENGGYLTDTILLLSVDEETNEASMFSLPRDLYIRITDTVSDKANSAYLRLGMEPTKRLFSRVTGVYIDHAVLVDFQAFSAIVDALDGVTITLEQPFEETQQWGYEFSLPEGENTLTGEEALYYVRSRYSTSDFDRAWRQQQVIVAIKDRVSDIGLFANPIKAFNVVRAVRKHVESDLDILDIGTLTRLARVGSDTHGIRRYVATTENLLYETTEGGIYRLLPRGGSLNHLKAFLTQLPAPARMPVIEPSTPETTND